MAQHAIGDAVAAEVQLLQAGQRGAALESFVDDVGAVHVQSRESGELRQRLQLVVGGACN